MKRKTGYTVEYKCKKENTNPSRLILRENYA
jgi:hypothetical protein